MSHRVDTMAFVGQLPWWGIGKDLRPGDFIQDAYPDMSTNPNGTAQGRYLGEEGTLVTGEAMREAADLLWTVSLKPATVLLGDELRVVPNAFALIRDDTGDPLSIVGSKYEPVQNPERFAIPDEMVKQGAVSYETAGSLCGGRNVWALLRWGTRCIRRSGNQFRGLDDTMDQYLLWYGSNDGNSKELAGFTFTRVVCKNTADAAVGVDGKRLQNRIAVPHTRSVHERIKAAHRLLLELHHEADQFQAVLQQLADAPMTVAGMRAFAADWMDDMYGRIVGQVDPDAEQREAYERRRARREWAIEELVALWGEGTGNQGHDKYDAYNAVVEWLDHKRGRYDQSRTFAQQQRHMHSTLVGNNYKRKGRALRLLTR